MQLDAQVFLRLAEKSKKLAIVDTEATGLRGDYNSLLVGSVKTYGGSTQSFTVGQPGNDKKLVRELKECLESFDCWVTYYGKGYDIPMLNTRLLRWSIPPVEKRPHIDMYYTLKYSLLTARRSQGHLLNFLETPEQKMSVSADVWNRILYDFKKEMKTMVARCESDASGLEALYERTKHLITDIKR